MSMLPPDEFEEYLAKAAHEVNRVFCLVQGDNSQVPWDQAPEWQRQSVAHGVRAILDDPSQPPEASHEGWLKEKVADGWVYGQVKDAAAKKHPCMVPYDKLPVEQQAKDHLFGIVVRALAGLDLA